MDQNLGTKWSRNLSEDSQTESNRLRLIERQRQLLESKLQRQHQVVATATRPSTARSIKSGIAGHRSCEKLIDLIDYNAGGVVNAGLSSTDLSLSSPTETFKNSVEGIETIQSLSQTHVQSSQAVSPFSSPKNSTILSHTQTDGKTDTHLSKSDKNSVQTFKINFDKTQEIVELNPLSSILSNEELLLFATQPISTQTTLQCTIIRDKKGLDRSFYPTYYMHLQESEKSEKLSDSSSPKSRKNSVELINFSNENSMNSNPSSDVNQTNGAPNRVSQSSNNNYRQVFLLSGRRRKKSKTYIIGNDPFDISRGNCIAKLKSNVLGTQFTAIRINTNGRRQEIASIIYETNVLGFKGPRKMTALIPKYDQINNLTNSSIFEEWKRNNRAIIQLKNKTPIWNDGIVLCTQIFTLRQMLPILMTLIICNNKETQSYVLNFKGRVTQASVKNFQLVTCNEREDIQLSSPTNHSNISNQSKASFAPTIPVTQPLGECVSSELVSMQFGRVSATQFSCDVSWPMSLLQAFAVALSSFDSKLACE